MIFTIATSHQKSRLLLLADRVHAQLHSISSSSCGGQSLSWVVGPEHSIRVFQLWLGSPFAELHFETFFRFFLFSLPLKHSPSQMRTLFTLFFSQEGIKCQRASLLLRFLPTTTLLSNLMNEYSMFFFSWETELSEFQLSTSVLSCCYRSEATR